MDTKSQRLCVWSGVAFCVVFGIGFAAIARFVPPPSPSLGAAEVAALYEQNRNFIRTGVVICLIGNGFFLPWTAVISIVMWRAGHALWSFVQLLGGGVGSVGPFAATMLWITAAFRPERDSEVILAMNDLAWFFTILYFVPVFIQFISIGMVGLLDDSEHPPWPRWVGYLSIWFAILAIPSALIAYFKIGPFAWDGLFGFWIPLVAFFGWFAIMVPTLLRSIDSARV